MPQKKDDAARAAEEQTQAERDAAAREKAQQAAVKAHDLEADQPEKDRRAAARDPENGPAILDREDAKRHRAAVREAEKHIPDGEGFSSNNPGARTQEEAEQELRRRLEGEGRA